MDDRFLLINGATISTKLEWSRSEWRGDSIYHTLLYDKVTKLRCHDDRARPQVSGLHIDGHLDPSVRVSQNKQPG